MNYVHRQENVSKKLKGQAMKLLTAYKKYLQSDLEGFVSEDSTPLAQMLTPGRTVTRKGKSGGHGMRNSGADNAGEQVQSTLKTRMFLGDKNKYECSPC